MVNFFHAYDLRGKYPEQISEDEAERLGKAYGTYIKSKTVLVGKDGRNHSDKITEAFKKGLKFTGKTVQDAGTVPTPVIYQGMRQRNIKNSAIITASHNPPEYTGFKFAKENALAMSREGGMKAIEKIYSEENFKKEDKGFEKSLDLEKNYIEFVTSKIDLKDDLKLLIDYGNGVTAEIGEKLFGEINCEIDEINEVVDGDFPNHLPDPTNENAVKQVQTNLDDHDLGIILDGDGDRAGFVIPNKGKITEDEVLSLFSEYILGKDKGRVLHDLRASKLVKEKIKKNGGEPSETRVGHTFISEEIHKDPEIIFAGELSGHYYFPSYDIPWDDGLFAALLMCEIASKIDLGQKLEEYPDYPVSPELRIDCPEKAKKKVIKHIKEIYKDKKLSTMDGVKIYFEDGWALVRPSNTEEKMSVRCEADTEKDLEEIRGDIERKVRKSIKKFS